MFRASSAQHMVLSLSVRVPGGL